MLREEPVHDGTVLVSSGIVTMAIVGVQLLVRGADPVEQRIAGFWRTDIVLEPDIHDDRTRDLVGKVDAIKVGDCLLDGATTIGMRAQKIVDFLIGIGVRQRNGIHKATEVRRSRGGGAYLWAHRRRSDSEATALATPGHAQARRVNLRAG